MPQPVETPRSAIAGGGDAAAQMREREHVDAESIRLFMDSMPEGLGAGFVAVAVIAGWLHLLGVTRWLSIWAIGVSAAQALCVAAYLRYRTQARTPERLRTWGRRFLWLAASSALAWGSAAFFFLPGTPDVEMMIVLGVTSIAVGGIGHMATHLPCYLGFLFAAEMPFVIALARIGDTLHRGLSLGLLCLIAAAALFARLMNRAIRQSIALAYRNELLAQALAVRTREAEQANLAKSRLLAAASHDLRQPVHAIGLLLDVLRGQGLDHQQSQTLDRLVRSARALDALFDGLLDVSRLDAGEVRPCLRAVPLNDLLRTLQAGLEALARDKRIALRVRPTRWAVNSDPVLLNRIIWNLAVNAIRCTHEGGVLVAARRRGGRVAVEVWDTGIGIAASEHDAVFEEFYQCGNPERDRARGLGLGLSIVRRLARLLDHSVALRSTPGRGSVFRVIAPIAGVPAAPAQGARVPAQQPLALAGTRVIVIDDDAAVREASVALLRQWGCVPTAFASVPAVRESISAWEATPDLIISDFRLPENENGLALVEWLRDEFNGDIPALLASGDTALAHARGSLPPRTIVLHKPIATHTLFEALVALRSLPMAVPAGQRADRS